MTRRDAGSPLPERPREPAAADGGGAAAPPGARPAGPSADSGPGNPPGRADDRDATGDRDGPLARGGREDDEYEPL